jgi:hypothetical protein
MNPLSGVLDEAWRMYKTFAKHLLAIAFVIYLVAAIITALLALGGGTVGILLGSFVSVVAAFVLQATLVKAVQDVRDGHADLSIRQTVNEALPFLAPVAGASILAGIAITIGLLLIIVPGLFLITIWAVIVPVIIIERSGALASFGRSRELVRGHGWHVFGTLVIVYIIMLVANIVLGLIFSALPHVLGDGLSSVISGTLISPFLAIVVTLVYYRLLGVSAPAAGGPPGGYQQGYGGYAQPPQGADQYGGGYNQSSQGGDPYGGGYTQPPQGGDPYGGGYNQPPQGGGYGGYNQPPQGGGNYGGYQQPPQGGSGYGGYQQPPQGGSEPPTQRVPRMGEGWPPPEPPTEPPTQPPR